MTDRHRVFRAFLRTTLYWFLVKTFRALEPGTPFLANWHLRHLCWHLQRVEDGQTKRLIICVPPRSMKSIAVSVAFVAWVLGRDPGRRVIAVSYAEDFARKLSIDRRTILTSAWFRWLFPKFKASAVRDLEVTTSQHGGCFAAGVGGAVLGRGADLIVVDDPLKGLDALSAAARRRVIEFYTNTLVTRLNDKREGAIVIVAQRLHEDDLVGYLLRTEEGWAVLSLPAIATEDHEYRLSDDPEDVYVRPAGEVLHAEREPLEILEGIRRTQGSLTFSAQYQQAPIPPGGNVIKREWIRTYDARPVRFDRVVVSWDTASTLSESSDWSVGAVWGAVGLDYYLLDVVRERLEAPELRRAIVRVHEQHRADATLIEDTELGRAIGQDLRRTGALRPIPVRPRFDKECRLQAQAARFEAGQVYLPREAPWLAAYLNELLAFPAGRHDDQVDATSQALEWLTGRSVRSRPIVRRDMVRREIRRRE